MRTSQVVTAPEPLLMEQALDLLWDGEGKDLHALVTEKPELLTWATAEGDSLIHRAARLGETEVVRLLLDLGGNPNLRAKDRATPIHACSEGVTYANSIAALHLLVRAGGRIEARNSFWKSPLMVACRYSNLPHVAYLLAAGASTTHKDRQGRDAFAIAIHAEAAIPKTRKFQGQRSDVQAIIELLKQHATNSVLS